MCMKKWGSEWGRKKIILILIYLEKKMLVKKYVTFWSIPFDARDMVKMTKMLYVCFFLNQVHQVMCVTDTLTHPHFSKLYVHLLNSENREKNEIIKDKEYEGQDICCIFVNFLKVCALGNYFKEIWLLVKTATGKCPVLKNGGDEVLCTTV